MHTYTVKRSVISIICLMAVMALAGMPSILAEEKDDVTLTMMVFESPALTAEVWDTAIETVLKGLPSYININKITSPNLDRDAYAKQLQATGQFPDIPVAVTISDFAQAGLLTPFDDAWLEETFIMPRGAYMDGKSWAPPNGAQIIPFVFYNKAIFQEVGVQPPSTWDEFLQVSQALLDAGHTPLLMCGAEPWCGSFPAVSLVSANVFGNDADWIAKRKAGEVKFSDPEFVAPMQQFQDLVTQGYISDGALGEDFAGANQAFYDGQGAMYAQGSWFIGYLPDDLPFEAGVFLMPRADGKIFAPFYVGGGVRMSAVSKHPEELEMFVKAFSTSPEQLSTLIEKDALFPMIKGKTLEDWNVTVSNLYKEAFNEVVLNDDVAKVSAFSWSNNDDDVIAGVKEEFYASIQNIFLGTDVTEEMTRLDKVWDDSAARLKR